MNFSPIAMAVGICCCGIRPPLAVGVYYLTPIARVRIKRHASRRET